MTNEDFGTRLRQLLKEYKMTQTSLAEQSGISRLDINKMVNSSKEPTIEQIIKIARVFEGEDPKKLLLGLNRLLEDLHHLPKDIQKQVEEFIKTQNEVKDLRRELEEEKEQHQAVKEIKIQLEQINIQLVTERDFAIYQQKEMKNAHELYQKSFQEFSAELYQLKIKNNEQEMQLQEKDHQIQKMAQYIKHLNETLEQAKKDQQKAKGTGTLTTILGTLGGVYLGSTLNRNEEFDSEDY